MSNTLGNRNNIVVYTAIFDNYDDLIEPPRDLKGCDFICFTDNKRLKSDSYKIILVDKHSLDPVRMARKYKILAHKYLSDYKYTLWVDSNIKIKNRFLNYYIKYYLSLANLVIFKHDHRNCLYDEYEGCKKLRKDDVEVMKKQIDRYRKVGYPKNNGMVATSFIMRKTTSSEVIKFCEQWWQEVKNYSRRDQLSFNYVAWKSNFEFKMIHLSWTENKFYKKIPHKKKIYGGIKNG